LDAEPFLLKLEMRNFSLELSQLKVFMEVAKDCNMTRAGTKLGLTQHFQHYQKN
jgi:hypothetical protein